MASSSMTPRQKRHHQHDHHLASLESIGTPPPSPSISRTSSSAATTDAVHPDHLSSFLQPHNPSNDLSNILHSHLSNLSQTITAIDPPIISLDPNSDELAKELSDTASSGPGFFQVINHGISQESALAAYTYSALLFLQDPTPLPDHDQPDEPIGLQLHDNESEVNYRTLCCDKTTAGDFPMEFYTAMEKVGFQLMEGLGFQSMLQGDNSPSSFVWLSNKASDGVPPSVSGSVYPFVIGLLYQFEVRSYLNWRGWEMPATVFQL